ncbi:MAG: sulfotransferase [Saprospiraceae bacterium]|nr:sulfotransferase [Saprospiraceae bacterium]
MSAGNSESTSLSHPLSGATVSLLVRLLRDNGPVPLKQWPRVGGVFLSALGRWPLTQVEKLITSYRLNRVSGLPTPIFIIGHWRSGTTHLCNILSKSSQFGFVTPVAAGLPWELLTMGTYLQSFLEKQLPSSRLIDNVPVKPDSPQEDEFGIANMYPVSFLHALYFPGHFERNLRRGVFFEGCTQKEIDHWKEMFRYYLTKVNLHQGKDKQLLIRNPVYTSRIRMIREIYPDAKFIHIYRNPLRIYQSMKNYYRKLLPALSLQPYHEVDIEETVLWVYARMMDRLEVESAELPDEDYIEVRFENLESDPLGRIERIYDQLQLQGFEDARGFFQRYLDSIKSYKKNVFEPDTAEMKRVKERWAPYMERWEYLIDS